MVSCKSLLLSEQHQQNTDFTKYNQWDRSQALVRFQPISITATDRLSQCMSTPRGSLTSSCAGCDSHRRDSCSRRRHSRKSSKRRHGSSSSHSCKSRPCHCISNRHRSRHYISVDQQHRPRELSRVATARQSSFSVLSQSSAAVVSDQQRRRRLTSKSDETNAQDLATLKNALSKAGKRSQVQADRKSLLRRSAVIELSEHISNCRGPEESTQDNSNAVEAVSLTTISNSESSDCKLGMTPLLTGFAHQQARMSFLWPDKKRFLVLRQTCLEIYASESAYNKGMADSCILLVGAKLQILNGNKLKIDSCNRSRVFRVKSESERHQWTQELERTIFQLSSLS